MNQQGWRDWNYQYRLGTQGFTTGTQASQQGLREIWQPKQEAQQRYDAAVRSTLSTAPATPINPGWSAAPQPEPYPPSWPQPYDGTLSYPPSVAVDVPAPGIIIAIRIMLALIVLGGVGGGVWAWSADDPHPIATGFSSAWLVVRVYLSVLLFVLSQLVLLGIEVCGVLWPFAKDLFAYIVELPMAWPAAAGVAGFAGLVAVIWGVRKLLSFVRPGFRCLTLLAVTVGGLALFVPSWWSAHVGATQSIIYWSEANISWLVVTREVMSYFAAS